MEPKALDFNTGMFPGFLLSFFTLFLVGLSGFRFCFLLSEDWAFCSTAAAMLRLLGVMCGSESLERK